MDKNGSVTLQALAALVVLLLATGVMLTLSGKVNSDVQDTQTVTTISRATNETVTANTTSLVHSATPTLSGAVQNTSVIVQNSSAILTAGTQYTLTSDGVLTVFVPTSTANTWNISYNHTVVQLTAGYNTSHNIGSGLLSFSSQYGNIGTIVAAALVIGLLSLVFGAYVTRGVSFK